MVSVGSVEHESFKIQFADGLNLRTDFEVRIEVVTNTILAFEEPDLGIEMRSNLSMVTNEFQPIALIMDNTAEIGLARAKSRRARLGGERTYGQIFEKYQTSIRALGLIKSIKRIVRSVARSLVDTHNTNVRACPQRPLDARDSEIGVGVRARLASIHIHHPYFELTECACHLGSGIDGNFLAGNGVDPDLAAEKQRIRITTDGEVEDAGIFQKELPLFGKEQFVWGEIKLLRIDIGIGEIGVDSQIGHQIRTQAQFDIDSAGMKGARAWGKSGASRARWEMAEAGQPIRFHDEEATAADVRDATQVARLTDARSAVNATPSRPQVFFVLSANEAFEVDSPDHVVRMHEV